MWLSKDTLYGWHGNNGWLFQHVNALHGEVYDAMMVFLTRTGDHHNFPYYMAALALWVLINVLIRKAQHKGGTNHYLMAWIGALLVLAGGYATDGLTVRHIKGEFAYPRPYIEYHDARVLDHEKENDGYHSFPSGHASFATLMVAGLWPVLSVNMALLGMLWVFGVCWSRLAVGMHFPADVLAGVLMSLFIVLIVRFIIYTILWKLFKVRC